MRADYSIGAHVGLRAEEALADNRSDRFLRPHYYESPSNKSMSPGGGCGVVVDTAAPFSVSSCFFLPKAKSPTVVSRAPTRRLPRVRWHLVFFVIVSLSATTAFSTTFPLKSTSSGGSTPHPININGLPSKTVIEAESSVTTEQDEEQRTCHKAIPSGNTNVIPSTTASSSPENKIKEAKNTDDVNKDDDGEDNKMATLMDDKKFKERILSSLRTVQTWETVEWIKDCRSIIPWDDLRNATGPYSRPEDDRALVDEGANAVFLQRFCRWFPKIMTWVNAPPCIVCGSKDCEMKTVREPETEEEIEGNARRVEVYYCPECDENTTTFPRYNKARKLLDTRKGRCGEYSNLFGLFCRAVGFETRLVQDLSDHLWTEIRLGDSWIMADPCEGIIDKPSMYEYGWGKNGLCYMIALGLDHVCDVTPRYTREFLTDAFQARRRGHTTSENASVAIIQQINMEIRKNLTLSKIAVEELERRRQLEESELQLLKQMTEWSEQEKYGRGRISGSLAWKQSRSEAGTSDAKTADRRQVASFEVESFSTSPRGGLSLVVHPLPFGRHDGIVVGGTACAIGETNSLSIVVVDEKHHGCILQSRSFLTWKEANSFVNGLPSQRIVIMNGKCTDDSTKFVELLRLGGWRKDVDVTGGIAFIGQMDCHPDWTFFSSLADCPSSGYEVVLNLGSQPSLPLKLRTERHVFPRRVVGRLPDSNMPLKTQLIASDHQKRSAFTSFIRSTSNRGYSGYVTKAGSPVYLLDSTSFPLSKVDSSFLAVVGKEKVWHTVHFLPDPLVPSDDEGISSNTDEKVPAYDIPLETSFFSKTLGRHLLTSNGARLPIHEALYNSRLIGLYFSAHWCGPCRTFTPMLAEMYAHLKEHRQSHGLEIVFVSGDRDEASFGKYFQSMPWLSIPFDQLQTVKGSLNVTYGVRGIPSLVILDAVSGEVVVPANESRQAVGMACRGGEQQIENLLETWLQRSPAESKEILSMLEMSCQEPANDVEKEKDTIEHSYLVAEPLFAPSHDIASRIKNSFEKLVIEGNSPTSAAAKAIDMVAEEQKIGRKFDPGALSGKASKAGKCTPNSSLEVLLAVAVELNSPLMVLDALKVAAKYVGNAMTEPWSSKFRSFKLSNQIADKITRLEGGLAVLQELGFEIFGTGEEFRAIIPVSADLEDMNHAILRLIESVNRQR